jgi:hypothetical protein
MKPESFRVECTGNGNKMEGKIKRTPTVTENLKKNIGYSERAINETGIQSTGYET